MTLQQRPRGGAAFVRNKSCPPLGRLLSGTSASVAYAGPTLSRAVRGRATGAAVADPAATLPGSSAASVSLCMGGNAGHRSLILWRKDQRSLTISHGERSAGSPSKAERASGRGAGGSAVRARRGTAPPAEREQVIRKESKDPPPSASAPDSKVVSKAPWADARLEASTPYREPWQKRPLVPMETPTHGLLCPGCPRRLDLLCPMAPREHRRLFFP